MRWKCWARCYFFILLIAVIGKKSWNDRKARAEKPKQTKSWNDQESRNDRNNRCANLLSERNKKFAGPDSGVRDTRSGIWNKLVPDPDPGAKNAPDPGHCQYPHFFLLGLDFGSDLE
jgi:hypothetical protein